MGVRKSQSQAAREIQPLDPRQEDSAKITALRQYRADDLPMHIRQPPVDAVVLHE